MVRLDKREMVMREKLKADWRGKVREVVVVGKGKPSMAGEGAENVVRAGSAGLSLLMTRRQLSSPGAASVVREGGREQPGQRWTTFRASGPGEKSNLAGWNTPGRTKVALAGLGKVGEKNI